MPIGEAPTIEPVKGKKQKDVEPIIEPTELTETEKIRKGKYETFLKVQTSAEVEFKQILAKFFQRQKRLVLNNLRKLPKGIHKKDDIDYILFSINEENIELINISRSAFQKFLKNGVLIANHDIGESIDFNLVAEHSEGFIKARLEKYVKEVNEETALKLSESLKAGLEAGESIESLRKRVEEYYDSAEQYRSMRIARTESAEVMNRGIVETFKEAGVEKLEWLSQPDACELCAELDGKIETIGGSFGDNTFGDKMENPPLHCNCLIDGQVAIYTSKGFMPISKIKGGDLVLTHKGRFRKVKQLIETPHQKANIVKITIGNKFLSRSSLTLTEDHPVLVDGQWKFAKNLQEGDKIKILANKCRACGKVTPYYNQYCSLGCHSKELLPKLWANSEFRKNILKKALERRERLNATEILNGEGTRKKNQREYSRRWRERNPVQKIEAEKVLVNHSEVLEFVEKEIKKISKFKLKEHRTLWNLEVEEDESYLAKGFVVHNCLCTIIASFEE